MPFSQILQLHSVKFSKTIRINVPVKKSRHEKYYFEISFSKVDMGHIFAEYGFSKVDTRDIFSRFPFLKVDIYPASTENSCIGQQLSVWPILAGNEERRHGPESFFAFFTFLYELGILAQYAP